jgi:hypothetical protein
MNEPQTGRSEPEFQGPLQLIRWAFLAFCLSLFLLPILFGVFYQSTTESVQGRVGLILPVLTMAQPESRSILWQSCLSVALTLTVAQILGLWLGMAASVHRGIIGRCLFSVVLMPGQIPAWTMPWLLSAFLPGSLFQEAQLPTGLFLWLAWVAWWGSLRIAIGLSDALSSADPSADEAAMMFDNRIWSRYRLTIRPLFQNQLRQTLLLIACVTLFDPTPAMLNLTQNLPVARILALLHDQSGMGPPLACVWFFWSAAIILAVRSLLSLFFSVRHTIYPLSRSCTIRGITMRPPLEHLWALGLWPHVLAIVAITMNMPENQWGLSGVLNLAAGNSLGNSFIIGLIFCSVLSLSISTFNKILPLTSMIFKTIKPSVLFWPVAMPALSVSVIVSSLGVSHHSITGWPITAIACWFILFLAIIVLGLGQSKNFHSMPQKDYPYSQTKMASFEAAVSMGASHAKARRMSGQKILNLNLTGQKLDLFCQYWWVWCSPAWYLASFWPLLPIRVWGEVLAEQPQARIFPLICITIVPWLVTMFFAPRNRARSHQA